MKLKRLHIYNIASIEEAVIDFERGPLADDTRFLICGPTGAGKTTILDAVCLALYNTTPRLKSAANEVYTDTVDDFKSHREDGSVSVDDPRMLMRRGTARSFVELNFTDKDGVALTALWSCSKAREKVDGKVQDIKWNLSDADGNLLCRYKSEVEAEIERRIGLNFDQFCRTTMLSQGEFTKFLKAKDYEKSEILEKLTGTEIYSRVSMNIQKLTAGKREIVNEKEAEIRGIRLMTEDELEEAGRRSDTLKQEISGINERMACLRKQIGLLTDKERLEGAIAKAGEKIVSLKEEYVSLSGGLSFLKSYIDTQTAALSQMQEAVEQEKEMKPMYDAVLTIKTLSSQVLDNAQKAAECKNNNIKLIEHLDVLKKKQEKLKAEYEEASKSETLLEDMNLQNLIALRTQTDLRISSLKEYRTLLVKVCQDTEEVRKCEAGMPVLENECRSAQEEYMKRQEIFEMKKNACNDIIREIRATLSKGDTCPLCGQVISHLTGDEEFVSLLEPERLLLDKARITARGAEDRLGLCRARYETASRTLKTGREYLKEIEERLQIKYTDAEIPEIDKDIETLQESRRTYSEAIDKALKQQETVSSLQKLMAAADKDAGETSLRIKANQDAAARYEASCTKDIERMDSIIIVENWRESWNAGPDEFIRSLEEASGKYTALCERATRTEQNISISVNGLQLVLAAKRNIDALYPQWDAADVEAVKVPMLPDRWNMLHAEVRSNYDEIQRARKELAPIEKAMLNMSEIDREELESEHDILKRKADTLLTEQGALAQRLDTDRNGRRQMEYKIKEKEQAEKTYGQWYRLYELFGSADGKKFRNIAQSYVLKQLLSGANTYLRRLTDRYELEGQAGSLTILLKDKEAGGVLRPVTTVSGGESFLISLSLALGLSSLSSRALSMDILFIDEGFGTLDSTYLDTVMETLERLHQMGGRKVGIISHVESLKERLSTQIRVERLDSTTSKVEIIAIQ